MIVTMIKQYVDDRNIYTKRFRPIYDPTYNTLGLAPFTLYYYGKTYDNEGIPAGSAGPFKPVVGDLMLLGRDPNNDTKCKIYLVNKKYLSLVQIPYLMENTNEVLSLIGFIANDFINILDFNKED